MLGRLRARLRQRREGAVAFALDCCDREAISWVATTEGIEGEDVRDLMIASVESRFGQINRLPRTIEWLSDNGSGYIAKETRASPPDSGGAAAERGVYPEFLPIRGRVWHRFGHR